MSKHLCGQVFVLPSRCFVQPAADDDFVKILNLLCYAFEEKLFYTATIILLKSHSKLSKNKPKNIP